jgi:hypothetical protein
MPVLATTAEALERTLGAFRALRRKLPSNMIDQVIIFAGYSVIYDG